MKNRLTTGGIQMEDFYCPKCFSKLERLSGCGAVGYMCHECKNLVSRSKMLTEEAMEKVKEENEKVNNSL